MTEYCKSKAIKINEIKDVNLRDGVVQSCIYVLISSID